MRMGSERGNTGPDALVELANGQQPGIGGELACGRLHDERRAEEVEDLLPGGWYTHRDCLVGCGQDLTR